MAETLGNRTKWLESIKAAKDALKIEEVDVPDFGVVRIKELSHAKAEEFQAVAQKATEKGDFKGMRTTLLVMSIVDDTGAPVFPRSDVATLGQLPHRIVEYLFNKCTALNALTPESREELAKNSEEIEPDDSGSVSPDS